MALAAPVADARGRNNNGNHSASHSQQAGRPGNMGRPSGNNGGHNNSATKPGNNGNGNHNNGNHNGNHNNGNHNNGNNGNHNGWKPGNNWNQHGNVKPPQNHNDGHFNGHGPNHPNRPPHYAWHRPEPPRHWRPSPSWRPFRSVLGIAFGSALNFTVQALTNNGYNVVSYGPSGVWVENVPMLNLMWPDAQLFYNSAGALCGSRFIYSTGYDNLNRYNMAYTSLINAYGMPVSTQTTASGMEVTWWGTNNQFIRLAYNAEYSPAGSLRYYTTLSFGN